MTSAMDRSAAGLLPACSRTFDAVDLRDVRMIERRERPGFAVESRDAVGVASDQLGKDFQRDVAAEPGVARAKHLPHAAFAEFGNDSIGAELCSGCE